MHEVSLVAELVEACERRAAGRPVSVVRVRHASSVPEDALRQAFTLLTEDGPLAAATLELEPLNVQLRCPCGFRGALEHDMVAGPVWVCPACGDPHGLPRGAELELIEVRTAPPTAPGPRPAASTSRR